MGCICGACGWDWCRHYGLHGGPRDDAEGPCMSDEMWRVCRTVGQSISAAQLILLRNIPTPAKKTTSPVHWSRVTITWASIYRLIWEKQRSDLQDKSELWRERERGSGWCCALESPLAWHCRRHSRPCLVSLILLTLGQVTKGPFKSKCKAHWLFQKNMCWSQDF